MTSLRILPVPADGAEDVLVGPDGDVWTGTVDGTVWRISADGSRVNAVGNTGGRPLGLEWYDDLLLVCDAHRGLLTMDPRTGAVELLVDSHEGRPFVFTNNAAVAADGTIWFSDSSTLHPIEEWKDDFVRDTRTGRLFRRDPDGTLTLLLDGLAFANGVALTSDESAVLVAETAAGRVTRVHLTGDKAGHRDLFVEDLPGYPDNIARGSDGLIWVTIASPRDGFVERLQRGPQRLRRLVTRIPEALQPKPKRTARVQAFDDAGRLVHDLDADASGWHMATGVREHDGTVWLGSLIEPAVAAVDLDGADTNRLHG